MSIQGVGTTGYKAPEILDSEPYNEKVDIWSLGLVIYETCRKKAAYERGPKEGDRTYANRIFLPIMGKNLSNFGTLL